MKRAQLAILILLLSPLAAARPQQIEEDELLRSVDEVLQDVSRIRGLAPKHPINRGVKSRAEIRSFIVSRVEKEYSREEIEQEERVLKRLTLIPQDMDLYEFMLELLTEQVAGYYDPYAKIFYLADWIPIEIQRPVMAHELMHALQDQHFGLEQFLKRVEGNDDQTLARDSLLEGESMAIMLAHALGPLGRDFLDIESIVELNRQQLAQMEAEYPIFAAAPAYLQEVLMFPYTYGAEYIQSFLRKHSWRELEQVYLDLPESTEQILHPEKYLSERDRPTIIPDESFSPIPSPDWKVGYQNVLGEFTVRLLLQTSLDQELSAAASAGWDGDRIRLLEGPNGDVLLELVTIWDTERDATEFLLALHRWLQRRFPDRQVHLTGDRQAGVELGRRSIRAQREGTFVRLVDAESPGSH